MDRFVQRINAEAGLQSVGDAPGQHLTCMPIYNGHQIQEPAPHRQIGDVRTPDLIRPLNSQPSQKIGIDLVPLGGLAGVRFLVDRHEAHQSHQAADAFLIDNVAFVAQMSGHLANTKERRFQKLFIDHTHQIEVQFCLTLRLVIKRRPGDRQQSALPRNLQIWKVRLNHLTPHLPVQGLSLRSKKSLATANSPILACKSLT